MTAILALIYMAFMTLGLPDALLGPSWPVMHTDLGCGIGLLGTLTLTVCIGTIISSVTYAKLNRYLKPGPLSAGSALMTGTAMLLISFAEELWMLYALCFILGLGAGAVDASLNTYVVLHYRPKHLNWLSAFWSIGTIFGPTVISALFRHGKSWRDAYMYISILQLFICVVLTLNLHRWKNGLTVEKNEEKEAPRPIKELIKRKSVRLSQLTVLTYCSTESLVFIWSASYITLSKAFTESEAALAVSMIYWGFMLGNIAAGALDGRLSDDRLIFSGLVVSMLAGLLLSQVETLWPLLASTFLIGFGFGPIITAIYHQAPLHFGAEIADSVMGLVSASSYVGSGIMPIIFGLIVGKIGAESLPWILVFGNLLQMWILHMKRKAFREDDEALTA